MLDWSPDDTKLLIRNFVSANESHLYVLDIATAALTPVSEGAAPRACRRRAFTRRRPRRLPHHQPRQRVRAAAARGPGHRRGRNPHRPHSLGHRSFARSDDGRYLAWVANVDGVSRLTVINLATRSEILPPLPDGQIGRIAFDRTGKRLALSLESPQSPRDVFVLELERNALVRYTKSEAGPVDPLQFVPAELVRYPTFDRANGKYRQIPAFVYRPRDTPGRIPVLIDIHGGPESQYTAGLQSVHAVPGARDGLRRDRAQRARLDRLWQELT